MVSTKQEGCVIPKVSDDLSMKCPLYHANYSRYPRKTCLQDQLKTFKMSDEWIDITVDAAENPRKYVRSFYVKMGKKRRMLTVPNPEWMIILKEFWKPLLQSLPAHTACVSYRSGYKIVQTARRHVKPKRLWLEDFKDFFINIQRESVVQALARFTDREDFLFNLFDPEQIVDLFWIPGIGLPQGSPTSPFLANLSGYDMDKRIYALVKKHKGIYNRYSDNLIISSRTNDKISPNAHSELKDIVTDYGLRLHPRKHVNAHRGCRMSVLGYTVNEFVNIPREYLRKVRAIVHNYVNGTLRNDLTDAQIKGMIAYIQTARPDIANTLFRKLKEEAVYWEREGLAESAIALPRLLQNNPQVVLPYEVDIRPNVELIASF